MTSIAGWEPRLELQVDGSHKPSWTENLIDARIELGLCEVGRCTLRMRDGGLAISNALPTVGTPIHLSLYAGGTLFDGVVTGVAFEADGTDHPTVTVIAHDKAYKLAAVAKPQSYEDIKFSDVVSQTCSDVGLSASVDATSEPQKAFLRQGNLLAAIDSVAHHLGWDWWCEGGTFHFKKPPEDAPEPALAVSFYSDGSSTSSDTLLWFDVRASAAHPSGVELHSWDRGAQEVVTTTLQTSSAKAIAQTTGLDAFVKGIESSSVVMATGGPSTSVALKDLATAHINRWAQGAVTARGEVLVSAKLKPGNVLQVDGAGGFAGTYPITAVEHVLRPSRFTTRFVSGPRRARGLTSLLQQDSADTLSMSTLRTATVQNLEDPEAQARVKILFESLGSGVSTAWARVALPGAGNDHGLVAYPEVGDEVLVGFEYGDVQRPVVLGGLFGSKQKVPEGVLVSGEQKKRSLKSKLGHVVELGDGSQPAEQFIDLKLKGAESSVHLGADKTTIEAASGKELTIKAGNSSITFATDGSIVVKAQKIVLDGQMDVEIKAGVNAKLTGTDVKVQAQASAELKGAATTQVASDGVLTVKGSLVQIN
ncbi:MAG: phage baseplate assembly protein V [Actinomycetales bacterium]